MNFADWYTDTCDVYRVKDVKDGNLTRKVRTNIYEQIPCRIYTDSSNTPRMSQTAASLNQSSMLAMSNDYDVRAGDELIIYRGGRLGHMDIKSRCFAGDPHHHFEPFGAVMPQLDHQEIKLLQEERI